MRFAPPAWKPLVAIATVGALSLAALSPVVAQTNAAPTPQNDAATTPEDTAVSIAVLSNDTDPDGNALSISSVGAPDDGAAVISGGSIVYTPDANFHGTDTFTYAVTDGALLASAQVTVTVTPVNDPPVAVNDTTTVTKNQAKAINVLANDTDVDGNTLTILSVTDPAHGTAVIADSKVTYTPDTDYVGSDTLAYVVSDGTASATGTVTITVKEPEDVPGDFTAKVTAACAASAGQPGAAALCNLYLNNDNLPPWARNVIGKNILKIAAKSGDSDKVLAACDEATGGSALTQLCAVYENELTPSWLRSQVGKLVLKLAGDHPVAWENRLSGDRDELKEQKKDKAKKHMSPQSSLNLAAFGDGDDDDDDDRKPSWLSARDDDDRKPRWLSSRDDDDDRRGGKDKGRGRH